MGLNHFTDYTGDELQALRGYKRAHRGEILIQGSSVLEIGSNIDDQSCAAKDQSCSKVDSCCNGLICGANAVCEKPAGSTESMDWSSVATATEVLSQGGCGSCWALAAVATIQLQAAKKEPRFQKVLSPENVNKCAPNEHSCGGTGGCAGSTPALAFEYLKSIAGEKGGLTSIDKLAYTATTTDKIPEDTCASAGRAPLSFLQVASMRLRRELPSVSLGDYVKVTDNHAEKVMDALVSVGPLAVAVVGSGLHRYDSGVLHGCDNAVVDHAVVMMGFGKDPKSNMLYWKIRNSWGKDWGENGFFRLKRNYVKGMKSSGDPMTDAVFQGEPCAWDEDPAKGVACKDAAGNYPKRTRVCGECGIVSDVAYPTDITIDPRLFV